MRYFVLAVLMALALVQLSAAIGPRHVDSRLKKSRQSLFDKAPSKPPAKKLINYVTLNEETGAYEFSQQVLADLAIEPKKNWIAKAFWNGNDYNSTGWSIFEVETNASARDMDQAFYAGFVEGFATKDLISLQIINALSDVCQDPTDKLCAQLEAFMDTNIQWMNSMILSDPLDPYWHQAALTLNQFYGLVYGYYYNNDTILSPQEAIKEIKTNRALFPTYFNLLMLQLGGDAGEIFASFQKASNPFAAGSCSALIKVLDGNADLYVAHDTWVEFNNMLRILKHYKLNYHLNDIDPTIVPGGESVFSSYPGSILSIDDFFLTKANLAVIETTIGNSNPDLWQYVTPQTNLYWVRIQIANRLAHGTVDWAKWFSLHNSGTYNNEWMVIDYKLFTPGQPLRDGLFVVLEQIPGTIVWEDKTEHLRQNSYWSSYNVAYYPYVYNISGTYDAYLKYGDIFSYDKTARAMIFRRDQSKVVDMTTMMSIMRYNDYTNDPLSKCDCNPPYSSELTIAARSDLNPINGTYPIDMLGHRAHGAVDMKLTNSAMITALNFVAISGPTYGGPNVPPFQWSKSDFGTTLPHYGQPDKHEFDPYYTNWNL